MYSSEELEKFYYEYQTEWMPQGMLTQAYCSRNNVPYKLLYRWIRDIYKRVVPEQVTGSPEDLQVGTVNQLDLEQEPKTINDKVVIKVNIQTSSGGELSRSNLDYRGLKIFFEVRGSVMRKIVGIDISYYIKNFMVMRCKYCRIFMEYQTLMLYDRCLQFLCIPTWRTREDRLFEVYGSCEG